MSLFLFKQVLCYREKLSSKGFLKRKYYNFNTEILLSLGRLNRFLKLLYCYLENSFRRCSIKKTFYLSHRNEKTLESLSFSYDYGSVKKMLLKISQNSQECWSVFLNKVACLRLATLLKGRVQYKFLCELCEIFKNTFFIEHLW